MNTNLITPDGYYLLEEKVRALKEKLVDANKAVSDGVDDQDFREDSKFIVAMEEREKIQLKIESIEDTISNAVVAVSNPDSEKVGFGNTVRVLNLDTENERTFTIVGIHETNPKIGKISHASPFGKAIVNTSVGDECEIVTPSGEAYWEVLEIS
ncbi:GreA/GreB family elongation factor [bacterium]|nr:GreA/GreB family elongation factor [bacterium]